MSQVYKEKILRDIDDIPVDVLPQLYRIVHLQLCHRHPFTGMVFQRQFAPL